MVGERETPGRYWLGAWRETKVGEMSGVGGEEQV